MRAEGFAAESTLNNERLFAILTCDTLCVEDRSHHDNIDGCNQLSQGYVGLSVNFLGPEFWQHYGDWRVQLSGPQLPWAWQG